MFFIKAFFSLSFWLLMLANISMSNDKAMTVQNGEKTGSDELFLVDGSGYIFRAYYALPQNLTNKKGQPVGAVLGFTNMLMKLLTDLKAPYVAVIFDAAKENFRYDIYPDYKANRESPPEDLIPQFPLFRTASEAFGIPALEVEGYEADDVIAAYAKCAADLGRKVTIVGSDKDLMQLITPNVRLYDPMKGKYIGSEDVVEKFGVAPERMVDLQALAGDSVDNVPGVPGIGVKTAAQLLAEYGDLETLLARAGEIKQNARRQKLLDNAENARLSKRLVTLDADAPIPLKIEDMKAHDPDTPDLRSFCEEMGFKSILTRLGGASAAETAQSGGEALPAPGDGEHHPPEMPIDHSAYRLITDLDELRKWVARAYETGELAIDTETTHLTPAKCDLVGIALSPAPGEAAYLPLGHRLDIDLLGDSRGETPQIPVKDAIAALKPVLEDPRVLKIGQNLKYDWQVLACLGIGMTPCDDTLLLSYTLDGTLYPNNMDDLSRRLLNHSPIKYEEVCGKGKNQVTFDKVDCKDALAYAAEDADVTLRLHKILKPRIAAEKMARVYEEIERPLIPVIAQMEARGIKVDRAILKKMSGDFAKELAALEIEIHKDAGTAFNVGSPKQIGEILFGQMDLPGGKKTKTGQWATDVGLLENLAAAHPIVQKILDWRQLSKLKGTYTDALQDQIHGGSGRVHTSFSMAGTSTGRLASSDPNLQNIPIRTEAGRKIREAFVAEDGHVLLSVDYSQVELRLAAEMADVKALKQAFRDGVDIHALTAAQIFGLKLEEVTPDIRRQAKAVNFGIIYGISGWGLAKNLGIGQGEANEFIRRYLNTFREIQDYMEARKAEARQHGFVRTLYGRKCYVPNINAKQPGFRAGAERQAINAPLQGTAADIMKLAMTRLPGAIAEAGLNCDMLLQVHDELIFEVPEGEAEEAAALVKSVMENVAELDVPLVAETGIGKSWAAAH